MELVLYDGCTTMRAALQGGGGTQRTAVYVTSARLMQAHMHTARGWGGGGGERTHLMRAPADDDSECRPTTTRMPEGASPVMQCAAVKIQRGAMMLPPQKRPPPDALPILLLSPREFCPGDFVRVHTPSCRVYAGGLWLAARPNHYALQLARVVSWRGCIRGGPQAATFPLTNHNLTQRNHGKPDPRLSVGVHTTVNMRDGPDSWVTGKTGPPPTSQAPGTGRCHSPAR
jgi:hypothetical protein